MYINALLVYLLPLFFISSGLSRRFGGSLSIEIRTFLARYTAEGASLRAASLVRAPRGELPLVGRAI